MAESGISTLGILFGYGVESTADTKPNSFTKLSRINSVGSINLTAEQIDASALEDEISRFVQGRMDTGGNVAVTVNLTNDTVTEWSTLITAYKALADGKRMWFEVYSPYLTKSFFFVAQPPTVIPMPDMSQNSLMTVELTLTIEEYIGLDTAVVPA